MNKVTITSQDTKCTTTYMAEISRFLLHFRNEEMRGGRHGVLHGHFKILVLLKEFPGQNQKSRGRMKPE
jgi:hypothetical protein